MGGIISALLCLYIRSGCQASVVASALTFHPPDPCYRIEYDEERGSYALYLHDDSADVSRSQNIKVDLLTSRTKTKIPVVVLRHPNAKYTIIYSHGNATDCGAMLPMYKMICDFLKVNVVGYDYTGYGASMEYGKRCTEKQTYIDLETVYEYCLESKLNDVEVNFKHGRGLLEAAPEGCRFEPWWVPGRGHNDVLLGNESEFIRRMAGYLQHVTQFHLEGRSQEIHSKHNKHKKKVKNQDYVGVQDKEVAMQQVTIV